MQLLEMDSGLRDVPIDPPAACFLAIRLDAFDDEPRPAVVQRLVEQATVMALAGVPGSSKTAVAIDMGLHVSAEAPWFGFKVTGGAVVYFAAEAPGSVVMRARAAAARKFPGMILPFYVVSASPMIGDETFSDAEADRMIETIRQVAASEGRPVQIAFVDTLASCLGDGDENSDGMIRIVNVAQRIAQETRATVCLVHHPSKADAGGLRGHGSLLGKCDTVISIEVDPNSTTRIATLIKSRDFAAGLQLAYELEQLTLDKPDQFGDPRTTILVKPVAPPKKIRRPDGRQQEKLLTELERRHRSGETAWDLATVKQAAKGVGLTRNNDRLITGLRTAGFLRGSDAHLVLAFPPEGES
jgi:hypothetical protein